MPTVDRVPYRPSAPLRAWRGERSTLLDGLAAGGRTPALVDAYAVRVVAEFQAFARDLHDVCTARLIRRSAAELGHHRALHFAATAGRRLDVANPSLDTLSKDFARLGLHDLNGRLTRAIPDWTILRRQISLLLDLRNAAAHGDLRRREAAIRDGAEVTVAWIGRARSALDVVAGAMDLLAWMELTDGDGR